MSGNDSLKEPWRFLATVGDALVEAIGAVLNLIAVILMYPVRRIGELGSILVLILLVVGLVYLLGTGHGVLESSNKP